MSLPFYVSAPGKILISGEYSVIFFKPAIASSLDLRTYLLVSRSSDKDKIRFEFSDINFNYDFNVDELPWDKVERHDNQKCSLEDSTLSPNLMEELTKKSKKFKSAIWRKTFVCFLYLYLTICTEKVRGINIIVKSTIPVGKSLGSSAATSVCFSSAFLVLGGYINFDKRSEKNDSLLDNEKLRIINYWSYIAEKCFHGSPSGVDNFVSTYGGLIYFKKKPLLNKSNVELISNKLLEMNIIISNTNIDKSTLDLVSKFIKFKNQYPEIVDPILDSIGAITTLIHDLLFDISDKEEEIHRLLNVNHKLLNALDVSHPVLEELKSIIDPKNIGGTKLTGAGGGGCAFTLLKKGIDNEIITNLKNELSEKNITVYTTKLSSIGVGYLNKNDLNSLENDFLFSSEHFKSIDTVEKLNSFIGVENIKQWCFW